MKMNSLRTDPVKAKEGIWVDDIPDFPGVRLHVRPGGNPEYRSLYQRLVQAVPRSKKRGGMITDPKAKAEVDGRCLADTILLGWDGFEDDKSAPLVYSADFAKAQLIDVGMGALRDAVQYAASIAEEEARVTLDEDSGN